MARNTTFTFDLIARYPWNVTYGIRTSSKNLHTVRRAQQPLDLGGISTFQCWCLYHFWSLKSCVSIYKRVFWKLHSPTFSKGCSNEKIIHYLWDCPILWFFVVKKIIFAFWKISMISRKKTFLSILLHLNFQRHKILCFYFIAWNYHSMKISRFFWSKLHFVAF